MQILDFGYMAELFPYLLGKLPITLGMASAGMLCALVLASGLAIVRVVQPPLINGAAKLFISFFRGTPLLVQLFLFYYGLPQLIESLVKIDGVTATILGLTLHFSAYMAESIRAAIVGIDRSQTEAALSIGMTQSQLMRRIVLPQATRIAVPTLMNYFIDMIKSTSLAFTLGVTELMGATQKEASSSFLYFEAFLTVAVIYWVVVELLSRIQKLMERKLNKAYQR
ncbi:amino acid ABC transporter permease [Larsenimonas salina]|nr:amino acid ABC transporter permease [Larsenimonas salina]